MIGRVTVAPPPTIVPAAISTPGSTHAPIPTRQLSPTDAIGYLSTRLPIDRHVAETDVRRIACNPIEACAAILGWRELTALRDDVRAARGSRFSLSAFHDDVFAYGGLPVPLIRWGLGLDG